MGSPTLYSPADLQTANDQVLNTLFALSLPAAPQPAPTYSANLVYNAPPASTPPAPKPNPTPSKFAQWWEKPSAISDSLTNGNLVEIGAGFLGAMVLISILKGGRR